MFALLFACSDLSKPGLGHVHTCVAGDVPDPYAADPYESLSDLLVTGTVVGNEEGKPTLETPVYCTARQAMC